jgi:hypothetical protein
VTVQAKAPISARAYDWFVHLDGYDGARDAGWQPKGYGRSRREALIYFAQEYEAHEEDK